MTKRIHWLFGATLMLLISCGDVAVNNDDLKSTWKTYKTDAYSISHPSAWLLDESGHMGTMFLLSCPRSDENDVFTENVNLLIQRLGTSVDLDQFVKDSDAQLGAMVGKDKIIVNSRHNANGKDFQKMSYMMSQATLNLRIDQYYWVIDGMAYVLTFTAEVETYDDIAKEATKIMDSFKFL